MRENRMKWLNLLKLQRANKLVKLKQAKIVKIVNKEEADATMHPFLQLRKESYRPKLSKLRGNTGWISHIYYTTIINMV